MTENLTAIERALLDEFESLAAAFETLAQAQSQLSERSSAEMKALSDRQNRLEAHLTQVSEALERQNELTTNLINKALRLSSGLR